MAFGQLDIASKMSHRVKDIVLKDEGPKEPMAVEEIAKRLEGQPVQFLEFCIKFMRTTDIDEF